MMYRYQLHTHTSPCSRCARMTPEELCLALREGGYAGAVLTNHFRGGNTGIDRTLPWQEFVAAYEADYLACREAAKQYDLDILFGIEEGFAGLELLAYGLTPELLYEHSELYGRDILEWARVMRECGVVERLNQTAQNALCNIVTIFLGLAVGSKLSADQFLSLQTLGILLLGAVAFSIATATGVIFAKIMNLFSKEKINPLIGAAGVSAVPMAARVANKVGLEADPQNFLLMHAMGPNVAGVIGSAVAAGVLLCMLA